MEARVQIEGLRELALNADRLKRSASTSVLRSAVRAAGSLVGRAARKRVRRIRTGNLRKRGVIWKVRRPRYGNVSVDIGWDRQRAFYGGFVELGTRHTEADPHLVPALEAEHRSGAIDQAFVVALNKAIARTLGRVR